MYVKFIMLIQLKLKNIALVEIIEINFEKGLNIFTGDSGSGKSLILDSLNVLFGGNNIPLKHLIRPGKDNCLIEAKFFLSDKVKDWLMLHEFNHISSEIVVKRNSFKKNNKILTRYLINESPINKNLLEELGLYLIDFAGQSDSFLFDSSEYRREIIDELGSKYLSQLNLEIKKIWVELESLTNLLSQKRDEFQQNLENNIAIKNMYKILKEADLNSCDEIIDLKRNEFKYANNFEIVKAIQETMTNIDNQINEKFAINSLISDSIRRLNKVSNFDNQIQDFNDKLINIQDEVDSLHYELSKYLEEIESDDISLEKIQNRLSFLGNLERTFSLELPELIQKRDELKKYIDLKSGEEEIYNLEKKINSIKINLETLFKNQSFYRKKVAENLKKSVSDVLKNLDLPNSKFSIDFKKIQPTSHGNEKINFLFSANPDQILAPLSKVISGGEMSRFLLAIKSCISKKTNTFFLDEIDNGLSGKSLSSLVQLIKNIAEDRQVLCITHQPFLAAAGSVHFKVQKSVIDGVTYTSVQKLVSKAERQKELVDLIGSGFKEASNYASKLLDRAAA